jgi:6-phosphogluconolactonase (cycloisomerase 2 family)
VDPSSYVAVNGCAKAAALRSPQTVVLSPDDRFAYTPSNSAHAITEFRRAPGGALSRFGCVSSQTPGCQKAVDTMWAFGIAIPPDGRSLYLTTTAPTDTLDQFTRDPATGAIAQLAGADACLGRSAPCASTVNLGTPRGLAFSPDSRFLYATSFSGDKVVPFARNPATSRLTPIGCVREGAATAACPTAAHNLDGATDVDVSPDGRSVYVTSFRGDAITAFARDPQSGLLAEAGCWAQDGRGGCAKARGLDGAYDLAISPDGRNVYVAARFSRAVVTFARDAASGRLAQQPGRSGCVAERGADGCLASTHPSLHGVRGVTVSPDGRNVYAGAFSASAISIFSRRAGSGTLRQLAGTAGCITNREPGRKPSTPGCAIGRGLHQVWGIAITRDGSRLYSGDGGDGNSGLAVFRRRTGG